MFILSFWGPCGLLSQEAKTSSAVPHSQHTHSQPRGVRSYPHIALLISVRGGRAYAPPLVSRPPRHTPAQGRWQRTRGIRACGPRGEARCEARSERSQGPRRNSNMHKPWQSAGEPLKPGRVLRCVCVCVCVCGRVPTKAGSHAGFLRQAQATPSSTPSPLPTTGQSSPSPPSACGTSNQRACGHGPGRGSGGKEHQSCRDGSGDSGSGQIIRTLHRALLTAHQLG